MQYKNYYTVIVKRPVNLPIAPTTSSNCLYPAWYQATTSSTTQEIINSSDAMIKGPIIPFFPKEPAQ